MKILLAILLIPLFVPAFADSQTSPTDGGTLDVTIDYDTIVPSVLTKIAIDFINPHTQKIQEHVDYAIIVSKDNTVVFGSKPLVHSTKGSIKVPVEFSLGEGTYTMDIKLKGILFQIIPTETASFDIVVGRDNDVPAKEDGGCLIATAAYGSEMAPQVQQLRELRDNTILKTSSGMAFMTAFNQFYYAFSPSVADLERENPVFKEIIKVGLAPMLSSLSLLNHVEIDSEQEMITYGISMILLNIGMYIGIPVLGILKLYQFKRTPPSKRLFGFSNVLTHQIINSTDEI